jgi:hypothetical protein
MKNEKNNKNKEDFVKLYVPELMRLVDSGDEKMCLMMAQLEYWFGIKPAGFYKFMSPAKGDNPAYRKGDSWTEEMGMSNIKIGNGLKPICTHYQSFTDYKKVVGDKFKGKFYCSYYHKPSHQTYYLRNHILVNEALESLSLGNKSSIFQEKHSSKIGNEEKEISGNTETNVPEVIEAEVIYTETNAKNTQKNNSNTTQEREEENSHFENIINKKEEVRDSYNEYCSDEDSFQAIPDWQAAKNVEVPFPADFELTEDMIGWAKANNPGLDEQRIQHSTKKFEYYHKDNKNKDWLKKWQLWIMDENPKFSNSSGKTQPSQSDIYREARKLFLD